MVRKKRPNFGGKNRISVEVKCICAECGKAILDDEKYQTNEDGEKVHYPSCPPDFEVI